VSVLTLKWESLREKLAAQFGKKPDLQGILFLIGVDELGKIKTDFNKEEKQDLIHIGICKVLTYGGYYEFVGLDEDGWPHYRAITNVPVLKLSEQEEIIRSYAIHHFEQLGMI
jgi:hypothetical protein